MLAAEESQALGRGAERLGLRLPRSVGAAAKVEVRSQIRQSTFAVRQAQAMSEQAQREVDTMLAQLAAGNENPGMGARPLGHGFSELRGLNGGRVIVRRVDAGAFDVVGKFQGHVRGDAANSQTIQRLIGDYIVNGAKK